MEYAIRAEDRLRLLQRENELLNSIIQGAADSIYAKDPEGRYLTINEAGAAYLNRTVEEVIGNTDVELLGERGRTLMERDEQFFATGKPSVYDSRSCFHKDPAYFRTSKSLLHDSKGELIGLMGVSRDITNARVAEDKYRFLFDNAPIAFWEEDFSEVKVYLDELKAEGVKDFHAHFNGNPDSLEKCIDRIRVLNVNRATLKMNGTDDKRSFVSRINRNFIPESERIFMGEFVALAEGKTDFRAEGSFVNLKGDILDILFSLSVLPGHEDDLSLILVSIVDITDSKRMASEPDTIKHRYRSIVEAQTEMICRISPKGNIIFRNPAFSRFFTFKDMSGTDETRFLSLFPPEEVEKCEHRMGQLSVRNPNQICELRNYDEDGNLIWQEWSVTAFFGNSGTLLGYQAVGSEVTDRKMAQEALAASEARWRSVFEHADDLIMTVNSEGYILSVNDYGELPKDVKWAGSRIDDIMLPGNAEHAMPLINKVFSTGRPLKTEYRMVKQTGEIAFYSCTLSPIRHGNRVITVNIIARNITETKAFEKHTKEALIEGQENERMRVSQELHDGLGQLFTAINLNLQHLKAGLGADAEKMLGDRVEALEANIGVAIKEVKYISRNLMPDVLWHFGLRPALEDLVAKCSDMADMRISLELVGADRRFPQELEKAFFRICQELLNNSIRHGRASRIFVQVINHGSSIVLMVEDDGRGFDPLKVSKGFGLRNIRSRTELLEGTVGIDSAPGRGTVTTIEIPLVHSS